MGFPPSSSGGSSSPGFEWSYTQRTSSVTIASTTESAGTLLLSPAAFTPDGSPVLVHLFAHMQADTNAATDSFICSLFEGATQITEMSWQRSGVTTTSGVVPVSAFYRFTPSAAAHTYTITGFCTSLAAAAIFQAGPGGTGQLSPAFVRFTKV